MQINTQEINGYLIDKFNQYGLEEGKTQGVCPLCSADRKPANQKMKCSSYDWETGLGTCHNCNKSFQLHTYQRKGASEKVYTRPITPEQFDDEDLLSTNVETWFGTRAISKQTLQDLQVTEGQEWMPQTSKMENTIKFNYFMGDQLINVKYRDGRKNFKLFITRKIKFKHYGSKSVDEKFNKIVLLTRAWHYNWSKFYYYRKNYDYI